MNKKQLILTVGASCSGKSSWAEEFTRNRDDWVNLNRDDVRFKLFNNGERDWTKYVFNKTNEKKISQLVDRLCLIAVGCSHNIVVSDTNLSHKIRNKWKDFANTFGYEYSEKPFVVEWEELRKRNAQRKGGISESLLRQQYYRMQEYLGVKKYVQDESLPKAFICDIDGNIATVDGRGHFDWDKVDTDKPRPVVIAMVHGLIEAGYEPIFLSGRDSCCMEKTYNWIMENVMREYLPACGGFRLYMRPEGDMRKDYVVKRELFDKYVKGKFNVCAVLDDRPQVINNCWNELGVPNVISTADQLLEF